MKILYYSTQQTEHEYGGNVIRKRNLALIKELVGDDNVMIATAFFPNSKISWSLFKIQRILGLELNIEKNLLQDYKDADTLFIDGTCYGSFSTSFLKKRRVISFFHNVEYDYFCQETKGTKGIRRKIKNAHTKLALYCYEKRLNKYADTIITLNKRDSDRLKKLYGKGSDLILPISMADTYMAGDHVDSGPYLLFVGSDFFGNTEGLFWFCEHCMPSVNVPLIAAGNGMEKYKDKYETDKIKIYGYVDDLSQLYRNAAAVVLPIISGSGMKTKTCEAMMNGKVIFGTSESFEGYKLSKDCIVCNSSTDFIEKINSYLDEGARYFSQDNRELFLWNYESDVVSKKFRDYFTGGTA